jgi:hypothetical protein
VAIIRGDNETLEAFKTLRVKVFKGEHNVTGNVNLQSVLKHTLVITLLLSPYGTAGLFLDGFHEI